MLTVLDNRPSVFEGAAVNDPVYLQAHDAEGAYAHLLLNFNNDKCAVHLSMMRWGAGVLKTMKEDWKHVVSICQARGCKQLFAINQEENAKWYKLIGHFGFVDYTETRVYHQEV